MSRTFCASLRLAVLFLCAISTDANAETQSPSDQAWRQAQTISELRGILDDWLDTQSDFDRHDVTPTIRMISASLGASMNGHAGRGAGRTRGLYAGETSTIYLIRPWTPTDVRDVGVLLHELVHHRQASKHYYCPGAREKAAYRLQDAWLREQGLKANVNWIAVLLESGCTPRDIHPD